MAGAVPLLLPTAGASLVSLVKLLSDDDDSPEKSRSVLWPLATLLPTPLRETLMPRLAGRRRRLCLTEALVWLRGDIRTLRLFIGAT